MMSSKVPEISVLMTAFNSESFLAEAIESVLGQETHRTWELLLVDDGSTDGTRSIAQQYATKFDGKVKVLVHAGEENRGISASRNLAIAHARGKFLAFLDSDDVWLPGHLETQVAVLDRMPEVAMVYAGAERWFEFARSCDVDKAREAEWGSNCLPKLVPPGEASGRLRPGVLLEWFRQDEVFVPCICTVVVRAEAARAVHGFCDSFRGLYDDQAFHAKIVTQFDVYANDVCTARYRQHDDSCCGQARLNAGVSERERQRFADFLSRYSKRVQRGFKEVSSLTA